MRLGKIVVVDDEPMVTSALKALLFLEGFEDSHFFNQPSQALSYIKENKPDIVISDFKMPEMSGLEFLSEVKKIYPEVSKIILTGYADKEGAIQAINEIGLYKYIEKPWDNDDLILTIQNGIERSNLISKLQEKIDELNVAKAELEKYSKNLEDLVAQKAADLVLSNSKLSQIITHCADGIITIDGEGKILQVNPACENLTGLSENNLKNKTLAQILYSDKNDTLNLDIENSEIFLRDYYLINVLSEKHIPVEISLAKIMTDDEMEQKYVGVIRDVSLQKETEQLRDDFIATLTHDLRTPLLAAIQTLKFFLDGSLGHFEDKPLMLLDTMKRSNEDLLGLVNALLEVYKFESGKLTLCKTDFLIKDLVSQSYQELRPLAENKNLEFVLQAQVLDDLIIHADRGELKRVIMNLLGNAINYTNKGGKITALLKEDGGDLMFSVFDTGNGIPKEDISHLFKRFSQGTSRKRSTGTGLGLYLSRQIIEAHNGRIWVESKLDKGSEFSFVLTDVVKERQVVNG